MLHTNETVRLDLEFLALGMTLKQLSTVDVLGQKHTQPLSGFVGCNRQVVQTSLDSWLEQTHVLSSQSYYLSDHTGNII